MERDACVLHSSQPEKAAVLGCPRRRRQLHHDPVSELRDAARFHQGAALGTPHLHVTHRAAA
jgi:hypothetical protein